MSVGANIPGKLTNFDIVGHILCEISLFCYYFANWGGFMEARVQKSKYGASPIVNGGMETPITLIAKSGNSTKKVFDKMEKKGKKSFILNWRK